VTSISGKGNQGIIVTGGTLTANDIAVGDNASIIKIAREEAPLSSVPSLLQTQSPLSTESGVKKYDVFISHASEDKNEIVRPLASALLKKGVGVWYDEFELRIGDSLREKIDHGLANSRLGIVVLSQAFIRKGWANYELNGIITQAVTGKQVLLPIWHHITKEEVVKYSPALADKVARDTSIHSVEDIAQEVYELLQDQA